MSSLFSFPQRFFRLVRTTLSLGGGVTGSVRLGWHVLRTEGWRGIVWRLSSARDITQGRQDPWRRFALEGARLKGQSTQRFERFWSGQDESLAVELELLRHKSDQAASKVAIWTLSRWHAREGRWTQVHEVLAPTLQCQSERMPAVPLGIKLLWLDALRLTGRGDEAMQWLRSMEPQDLNAQWTADLVLARANLLNPRVADGGDVNAWLATVNETYLRQGLAPIELRDAAAGVDFDNLQTAPGSQVPDGPLVSVIVPAYNASVFLLTALRSLAEQTWQSLEVLVVDDCSSDDTAVVAELFAAHDSRFKLIRMPSNQGAYAARNAGAAQAQGDFITVHDSDDWSHAQKIEMQVKALLTDEGKRVSFSHLSRSGEDLVFGGWSSPAQWRGYVYRNTSSMMVRRDVFERLGFWDQVRCSADAEYYQRAMRVLGIERLIEVMPGLPLSFVRVTVDSLTQHSDTNLFTLFGGLRQEYHDAFVDWHTRSFDPENPKSLYLEQHPAQRPFEVPEGMLRKPKAC